MTQIILNDDQAEVMQKAAGAVEVCNLRGELPGYFSRPPSAAGSAEAKRRLDSEGPWFSTRQVIEHLDSLGQDDEVHGRLASKGARRVGYLMDQSRGSESSHERGRCN